MSLFRLIAYLDVKPPRVVKGRSMEGYRPVGSPIAVATRLADMGADEIVYHDIVASLFKIKLDPSVLHPISAQCFAPLVVGGGINCVQDAEAFVMNGADRVLLNSAALQTPSLIAECSDSLGSQAVVLSVDAKRTTGSWEAMMDAGREHSGHDAIRWVGQAAELGAGEVCLTSIDHDGGLAGPDLDLVKQARSATELPLVVRGGISSVDDIISVWNLGADGVAISAWLHAPDFNLGRIRASLVDRQIPVRLT